MQHRASELTRRECTEKSCEGPPICQGASQEQYQAWHECWGGFSSVCHTCSNSECTPEEKVKYTHNVSGLLVFAGDKNHKKTKNIQAHGRPPFSGNQNVSERTQQALKRTPKPTTTPKRSECDEVSQTNENGDRKYQQEHTDMAKKMGRWRRAPKKLYNEGMREASGCSVKRVRDLTRTGQTFHCPDSIHVRRKCSIY